jgi:hypothetical protein
MSSRKKERVLAVLIGIIAGYGIGIIASMFAYWITH